MAAARYTANVVAVQRTHRLSRDRDWLPARVRRGGRVAAGVVWTASGVALLGSVVAAPPVLFFWHALVAAGAGAAVVGDRVGRAVFRRQLRALARGDVELSDLGMREEGELVVVRGTVEAERPLEGVLVEARGVYRRLDFKARGRWVHEAATDFSLVGSDGSRVLVQGGGARWLVPAREAMEYPASRLDRDGVSRPVRDQVRAAGAATIEASEQVLVTGTLVQVVGYKTTSADVSGEARGYRLPPQRATLRSGPQLPLVITRVDDLL
jgi:hypothetical protein